MSVAVAIALAKNARYPVYVGRFPADLSPAGMRLVIELRPTADAAESFWRFLERAVIGPVEHVQRMVASMLLMELRPLRARPECLPPSSAAACYFELARRGPLWEQLAQSRALAVYFADDGAAAALTLWAIPAADAEASRALDAAAAPAQPSEPAVDPEAVSAPLQTTVFTQGLRRLLDIWTRAAQAGLPYPPDAAWWDGQRAVPGGPQAIDVGASHNVELAHEPLRWRSRPWLGTTPGPWTTAGANDPWWFDALHAGAPRRRVMTARGRETETLALPFAFDGERVDVMLLPSGTRYLYQDLHPRPDLAEIDAAQARARRLGESIAWPGLDATVLTILEMPSVAAGFAWDFRRNNGVLRAYSSMVDPARADSFLPGYRALPLAPAAVEEMLAAIKAAELASWLPADAPQGPDGTRYAVDLFDGPARVALSWWSAGPPQWRALTEAVAAAAQRLRAVDPAAQAEREHAVAQPQTDAGEAHEAAAVDVAALRAANAESALRDAAGVACPHCRSDEIDFKHGENVRRSHWICSACGRSFGIEDLAAATSPPS